MDTGKSALGLDGNLAAALGYPIGIIAIICLIMEKENRFVKFHALQSILLHVAFIVIMIVVWILFIILAMIGFAASAATDGAGAAGGLMVLVGWLIYMAVLLGYLAVIIYAAVKSYGGNGHRLQHFWIKQPLSGERAQSFTHFLLQRRFWLRGSTISDQVCWKTLAKTSS